MEFSEMTWEAPNLFEKQASDITQTQKKDAIANHLTFLQILIKNSLVLLTWAKSRREWHAFFWETS